VEDAMKITRELRKAINAGVRRLSGACPLAEVGLREAAGASARRWVPNALNWRVGNDLCDMVRFADLAEIDDCPDLPGAATLDLYVTSGIGSLRELEHNVYVTIKDGALADIHTRSLEADARCERILGRPFSPPDALEAATDAAQEVRR
jgi:hypothetical protein